MSFITAIIVLSILKLTYTLGEFISAKRLKLPVEKFIVGIDWGKPLLDKKINDIDFLIYPIFWGGFLQYKEGFDKETKCTSREKGFLGFSGFITMMIATLIISAIGINFVPSGKYETFITKATEDSLLQQGDKIVEVNGQKINSKNIFNTILQQNRQYDGVVTQDRVEKIKSEFLKLNRGKFKNGELPANTKINLPSTISEGKITKRFASNTIKLNAEQLELRKQLVQKTREFETPVQLNDLATAYADTNYQIIVTLERNGEKITLKPISPDEFGNIGAEYKVNTIYTPREEIIKNFKKKEIKQEKEPTLKEKLKQVWDKFTSIFAMLALISILVLVHEAGHYLAARMFKIKVDRFGFGLPFGPTLWEKQCGETLVVVHAFLLGGYVSFPDDDKENPIPKDSPERFANKPIYQRLVVVSAGVFANVVCAIVIVMLTALLWGKLPTEDYQTFIKSIDSKTNTSLLNSGIKVGDKVVKVNNHEIKSNYGLQLYALKSRLFDGKISEKNATNNLDRILKLNPKFTANEIIPAGTLIKLPTLSYEEQITLTEDMTRGFEKITDNNFALTEEQIQLTKELYGKKTYKTNGNITLTDIAFAISDNVSPLYLTIERNGELIELPAILPNNQGVMGVQLDKKRQFVETKTLKSALKESCIYLYDQTGMLLKGLWQLVSGKIPLDNMHGVVAVVKYGGDVIQQEGFFQGLLLIALISLDLAIINFLPIPALDGGHVVFLLLEKIYGKPLDEETLNGIATAGFMFLILLMIIVLYNDIVALAMHRI